MSAIIVRAFAAIRRRPLSTLATALGLFFAGAILGSAVTTRGVLTGGLDRAQTAADTPDITARFDPIALGALRRRIETIANVRSFAARITVRPVSIATRQPDGTLRFGTAEVVGRLSTGGVGGIAIVAGRDLSGGDGEVVVDRGLYAAWGLRLGGTFGVWARRGPLRLRIVGVAIEPDDVAFPLASRPRIYLPYETVQDRIATAPGRHPVTDVAIDVTDRSRLAVTLQQLRAASFGLRNVTIKTRTGISVTIDEASGLISSVIVAFAIVALAAAMVMVAATAQARVTRDLATIGALRAIGFSAPAIAATYGFEIGAVALPAAAFGVVVGSFAVQGPAAVLLQSFNELPPPHVLGLSQIAVTGLAAGGAAIAAGTPALLAARRPVVDLLRGAAVVPTARGSGVGSPLLLGARLAVARPLRLVASVIAIAGGLAVVLLMLSLARTVLAAQTGQQTLGIRYPLLVTGGPGTLETSRTTAGVAAAATRYEVLGVDAFDLGQPLRVVAFGDGVAGVFDGRPLLSGRRASGQGDAEVGEGLSTSLGLTLGQTLVAELDGGGEIRLRIVGIVREPTHDGRVAYTDAATLLAARPETTGDVAVRPRSDVPTATIVARLARSGIHAAATTGLTPTSGAFIDAIVALLRAVAVVNGAGSIALALLALIVLARERAETVAIVRTVGGGRRHVVALLGGASVTLVTLALVVASAANRLLLEPFVERLLGTYGALRVSLAPRDAALVIVAALALTVCAAVAVAVRYSGSTVRAVLDLE